MMNVNLSPPVKTVSLQRRHNASVFQVITLLIVITLFVWFLLWPKYQAYTETKTTLSALQSSLQQLKADEQKLQALISKLKAAPDDVTLLDEALPLEPRVSKVYVLLDGLVKAAGLTLADMNVATDSEAVEAGNKTLLANPYGARRKLQSNLVQMNMTGTLDQFAAFLQLLETSSRVFNLETISIVADEHNALAFRVQLNSYHYAP